MPVPSTDSVHWFFGTVRYAPRPVVLMVLLLVGASSVTAQDPDTLNLGTRTLQFPRSVEIHVGKNVQISAANPGRSHFEVVATAHPSTPGVLLAGGMMWNPGEREYKTVVYRSSNRGRTWTPTLTVDRGESVQDPTLAFGPDGWAYFATFGGGWMGLYRSPDGGKHWKTQGLESLDRPWISVPPTSGRAPGRLYLHGTGDSADVALHRASRHGTQLRSPNGVDVAAEDRDMLATGNSAVRSDGTMLFPYLVRLGEISEYEARTLPPPRQRRRPNALLGIAVSADGGDTFETETVARWYHRFGRGRTATMPRLAVNTTDGPFAGRVYLAWTDFRSGEGQILLSHSDRPTQDWSEPVVVNRSGGPAFHPALAVNRRGVLGIHWYDRRSSESTLGWRARFAASRDGGVTVSRSVPVGEAPHRYTWNDGLLIGNEAERTGFLTASAFLHGFNESGGHTAGLTAGADGTFYPVWVDNRTGTPQMWTAPVEVEGTALRHGSPALSGLEDVTRRTALRVENSQYSDSTHVATLKVRLRNVAPDTLHAPFVLRLIDLWSEFGEVRLVGSQATGRSHGAVLPVGTDEGALPPDSSTAPVTIRARITTPRPLGPMPPPPPGREVPGYAILQVKAQALGNGSDRSHP